MIGLWTWDTAWINRIGVIASDITCDPNPSPPDAVTTLANDASVTNSTQVGLTWEKPTTGSNPIGYQIWYDKATQGQEFVLQESGITDLQYTVTGLETGVSYQFKIRGANTEGPGEYSNVITVIAAGKPSTPSPPTTSWLPKNVVFRWTAPEDGGSPITGYIVPIRQSGSQLSYKEMTYCDMANNDGLSCTIPVEVLFEAPFNYRWGDEV